MSRIEAQDFAYSDDEEQEGSDNDGANLDDSLEDFSEVSDSVSTTPSSQKHHCMATITPTWDGSMERLSEVRGGGQYSVRILRRLLLQVAHASQPIS